MGNVIWKAQKLGDLFEFSSGGTFALKNYKLFDEDGDGLVEIVTSSKDNSSNQFIAESDIPSSCPIYNNSLTINRNGSIGFCHYHSGEFIIPTGDSYTLIHKNEEFRDILTKDTYSFLSIVITRLFTKTVFGYSYKVNSDRFDREIILLPCLEVAEGEDYIWEENGKHYTLAVDYIKKLMGEAKELREQKTIRLYEAERKKYEAERKKYEAGYKKQRENIVWKSFKLGDLFDWNSKHKISKSAKEYDELGHYEDGYVANITAGMYNEGIACYLPEDDEIKTKKRINCLTISSNGAGVGACFFHDYCIVSTGDNALLEARNSSLQKVFDSSKVVSLYFAKIITKLFRNNGIFSWTYKVSKDDFKREIILLPCLEVAEGEDFIWEENGKHYTLAVDYISYLYLTGRVNYNQKLIDNYTYQY